MNAGVGSQVSQTPSVFNNPMEKRFGNHLSVSVVSVNNLGTSHESLYSDKTTASAPVAPTEEPVHRPFTQEELNVLTRKTSKDLGDERLKQFLDLNTKEYDDEEEPAGINSGVPRRSLRSFRHRKKRSRSIKRTRSMDPNIPNIIVTSPSREDNRILKAVMDDSRVTNGTAIGTSKDDMHIHNSVVGDGRMVKVIHF